jgi:hypothetical protein
MVADRPISQRNDKQREFCYIYVMVRVMGFRASCYFCSAEFWSCLHSASRSLNWAKGGKGREGKGREGRKEGGGQRGELEGQECRETVTTVCMEKGLGISV